MTRIYTEDTNRQGIIDILDASFDGYTIIPSIGRWRGRSEASLVIEVSGVPFARVQSAALRIKEMNHQEAVMLSDGREESLV